MRVVFALVMVFGGLWLSWLVLTGLPFPWDDTGGSAVTSASPAESNLAASQSSATAAHGTATPGATGGAGAGYYE